MYSYNVTRIFAPILLLTLTALHYKEVKKWPRINKIVGGLFAVAMFLPLAITLKNGSGFSNQVAGVFLNGVSTKSRLLEFRSYLIGIPEIYSKLFFNSQIMTIWEFLKNLLHSFSTEFFFFVGPKPLNGIANHGVFYPFELITIVVGLYTGWKRKEKYLRFFFLWLAIGILLIAMTQEVPHPTRSFMQVIPFVIFSAYGLLAIWNALKTIRHAIQRSMLQFGMIAVISYAVLIYFTTYFFVFPANEAKVWRASEADLITHLAKIEKNYDRIVIDSKTDFSYMALAFYTKLPPAEYQKKVVYKQAGLLTTAAKLKKYEFAEIDWDAYNSTRNTLYVTTIDGYQGKPVLQILTFPERQIVMPIGRTIGTFPFKDPAYVLIESPREPK
jgi:hypothetical protein